MTHSMMLLFATSTVCLCLLAAGCGHRDQAASGPVAQQSAVAAQIQQVEGDRSIPPQDKDRIIQSIKAKGGR